VRSANPYG